MPPIRAKVNLQVIVENPPLRVAGRLMQNLEDRVAHPGEWARIATHAVKKNASQMVYDLEDGHRRVPPGRWEFLYGDVEQPDGADRFGVWARYIGAEHPTKPKATDTLGEDRTRSVVADVVDNRHTHLAADCPATNLQVTEKATEP